MNRNLLDILACPSCRLGYKAVPQIESESTIEQGYLRCPECATVIPIIGGFVFFTETLLHEGLADAARLTSLGERLFGSASAFAAYRVEKRERDIVESYAAFHPFNESTRALLPLIPHVARSLALDDFILDSWARTGWSTEWLAGLFPQQRVVSIWEGNSSVLGYRGYRYLLGSEQRAINTDVLFVAPGQPLPFRNDAFGLTYALDSLHRYPLYPFVGETLRVTRKSGALIYSHLHLSNSEPEPFFERGCRYAHGTDYRAWLSQVCTARRAHGYVLSEAALWDGPTPAALVDDSGTSHYNGVAVVLPIDCETVAAGNLAPEIGNLLIVNPLYRIRLSRGTAVIDPQRYNGKAGELLERHPVYAARAEVRVTLEDAGLLAIMLAASGLTRDQLLACLPIDSGAQELERLVRSELLLGGAISAAAHALQCFHANQYSAVADFSPQASVPAERTPAPWLSLEDGTEIDHAEADWLLKRIPATLHQRGLGVHQILAVRVHDHPLLWLIALGAAAGGHAVKLHESGVMADPASLCIHGDQSSADTGWCLGLDGRPDSFLSALDDSEEGGAVTGLTGTLSWTIGERTVECTFPSLLQGAAALFGQIDMPVWALDHRSILMDLVAVVCSRASRARLSTV